LGASLEDADIMMSQRQAQFRADYRPRISPWYSGLVHVFVIYAIGGAVLAYCIPHIHQPTWAEWLVVPVMFLASNAFEWWIHRFVMHRPVPGFMGIYRRHTLAHHQFFTDAEPTIDTTRDFRITFFPPYALVTFIAMSLPPALILGTLWAPNAGWLLMCTTVGMYLNYELFHWSCHVKDDRVVRWVPFVNSLRRHHIAHHNQAIMMEKNFNLTYPIADWLFATSDLRRGLLGHLFNGYNSRYVRQDLRRARNSADAPADLAGASA
jgi:Fatty acid hydroxylase superfamily